MSSDVTVPRAEPASVPPAGIKFLVYLSATSISVTGDGAFQVAGPLLAAYLTRNPVAVSLVSAAWPVAWLAVGLPAGLTVDKRSRRQVMIVASLVSAVILCLLALLAALRAAPVWSVVAVVAGAGIALCYGEAASQAFLPVLVTREKTELARANSRYWTLDTIGRGLLGPLIGSALFSLSRVLPFFADAVSFLSCAALSYALPRDRPARANPGSSVDGSVMSGVKHILGTPALRTVTLGAGAYNFASLVSDSVLVLYAREVLHVPPEWYGALVTAAGLGMVVAGLKADSLVRRWSYGTSMAAGAALQAAAWAAIVMTGEAWVAAPCLALIGVASMIVSVTAGTSCQELTPDGMTGRVLAVYRISAIGGSGLGALCGGVVAGLWGLPSSLVASAVISGLTAVVLALCEAFRRRRTLT